MIWKQERRLNNYGKETNEKYPLSFAVKHNLQVDLEQSQSAMDNLQDCFEHASKPLEVYMAIKGVLNEEYRLKQVMVDVLEDITNQKIMSIWW